MQIRYTNAAQTIGEYIGEGVHLLGPVPPADGEAKAFYDAFLAAGGQVAPYQRFADLASAKAALTREVEQRAKALRIAVAGTDDATKLAVYREKYAVAIAALDGDQSALDALAPEAQARGETPAELAALVKSLGDAWTGAGLVIDAAYQSHKAAIAALAGGEGLAAAQAYDAALGWPR